MHHCREWVFARGDVLLDDSPSVRSVALPQLITMREIGRLEAGYQSGAISFPAWFVSLVTTVPSGSIV